jgi:hypothetical protein
VIRRSDRRLFFGFGFGFGFDFDFDSLAARESVAKLYAGPVSAESHLSARYMGHGKFPCYIAK